MTHEELLAKIDAITGIKYNVETNVVTYGNPHGQHRFIVNQALRAVVELHKPEPETFESSLICEGCTQGAFVRLTAYPCPTIQAIEKELK